MVHRLWLLAVGLCLLLLTGCERDGFPPLVEVHELGPQQVEVGDRVEVTGNGFPVGRAAKLTFRGTLYRPDEEPITGALLRVDGTAVSATRIELMVTDDLRVLFCGRSEHTTFEGELEVAFATQAGGSGAAPVYGILPATTFDVRVATGERESRAAKEGEMILKAHGIEPELEGTRLRVANVTPGSAADLSGVMPGDRLVAFDHVRVASFADIAVLGNRERLPIVVRRGETATEESLWLDVDVHMLRPSRNAVAWSLLVVLLSVTMLVLFGRRSTWFSSWIRVLAARAPRGAARARSGPGIPSLVVSVLVMVGFAAIPITRYLVVRDLDLPIVGALSVALGAYVLVSEDERGKAWQRVPRALLLLLPSMLLVLGTASLVGSLRIADAVRLQGVLPWSWNAFRDPAWLLLTLLWFGTFVVRVRDASWGLPEAMPQQGSGAGRVSGVMASALGVVLFFGGWRVPSALEVSRYGDAATLLGIALFAGKTVLAYGALAKARHAIAPLRSDRVVRFALTVSLPLVLLALGLGALGWFLRPSSVVEASLSYATFGGTLLLALRAFLTLRSPTFRTDIALS